MANDNAVGNQKVFVTLQSVLELQSKIESVVLSARERMISKGSDNAVAEMWRVEARAQYDAAVGLGLPVALSNTTMTFINR